MNARRTTAALALAAAGLGGGYLAAGLPSDSIASRHIQDGKVLGADVRDNTLTGADVNEATLGAVPLADAAVLADEASEAGHAATATRLQGLMRASVSAAGELRTTPSSGAIAAEQTTTPGRYVVTFETPLLGCFLLPGVAHNDTGRIFGSASAWITPGGSMNKVTVETHAAPVTDATPDPLPFSLLVVCETGL